MAIVTEGAVLWEGRRRQKTEDRRSKTGDPRQKTEDRRPEAED